MSKHNWKMIYIYLLSTGLTLVISIGVYVSLPKSDTSAQDRQMQYEDGQRAAQLGLSLTSNPYLSNHEDARTWLRGYMDYKKRPNGGSPK